MAGTNRTAPLRPRKLRDLDLKTPAAPGRPLFLSAASGLVRSGSALYVVADDELHLGCFGATGSGTLLRLFDGELPDKLKARKKRKADLEILLRWPESPDHPHGALLALGSGSRAQRRRGALLTLDRRGHVRGAVTPIDAAPLYAVLEREFDDLNLEGGWVDGDLLCLLQRGNKGDSPNAVIELDYAAVAAAVARDCALPDLAPADIIPMRLGAVQGVPLCFTDGCALGDGNWLFSAVAEDTDDARADGPFAGAVLGVATRDAEIVWQRPLDPAHKVEGIDARWVDGELEVLCVTDADDMALPAQLLALRVPRA